MKAVDPSAAAAAAATAFRDAADTDPGAAAGRAAGCVSAVMAADADPQASDAVRIQDTPPGAAERAAGLQAAAWVDGSLSCRPGRVRRWRRHAEQPELPPAAHWA